MSWILMKSRKFMELKQGLWHKICVTYKISRWKA